MTLFYCYFERSRKLCASWWRSRKRGVGAGGLWREGGEEERKGNVDGTGCAAVGGIGARAVEHMEESHVFFIGDNALFSFEKENSRD